VTTIARRLLPVIAHRTAPAASVRICAHWAPTYNWRCCRCVFITFLAHRAWLMVDAIGAPVRLCITHRNLLGERPQHRRSTVRVSLVAVYRRMIAGVIIALLRCC
jgi:hypothetical protein